MISQEPGSDKNECWQQASGPKPGKRFSGGISSWPPEPDCRRIFVGSRPTDDRNHATQDQARKGVRSPESIDVVQIDSRAPDEPNSARIRGSC